MAPLNLFRQSPATSTPGTSAATGLTSSSTFSLDTPTQSPNGQSPHASSSSPSKYNPTRLLRRKASAASNNHGHARADGPLLTGSSTSSAGVFADAQAQRFRGSLGGWTDDDDEMETVVILGPTSERNTALATRIAEDQSALVDDEQLDEKVDPATSFSLRPVTPPPPSRAFPTALSPPRRPMPSPRAVLNDPWPRRDSPSPPPPPSRRRSSYDSPPDRAGSPTWSSADERVDRRREENAAWLARKPSVTRNRKKSFSALNTASGGPKSAPTTPQVANSALPVLGPNVGSVPLTVVNSASSSGSIPPVPPIPALPPAPPTPTRRLEPPASLRRMNSESSQESEMDGRGYEVEVACVDRREDGEMKWEIVVRRANGSAPPGPFGPVHVSTAGSIALAPPGASSINLSLALDQPTGKLVFVSIPMDLGNATPSARRQMSRSETPPQSQVTPSLAASHMLPDAPPSPRSPRTPAYKRQGGLWSPSPGQVRQSSTDSHTSDLFTPRRMQSLVASDPEADAMSRLIGATDTVNLNDREA